MPGLSGLTALQCPQPPLALPFGSLRPPNALPLVSSFEPAELFGVHGLALGCPELAVGRRSRRELRLLRLAGPCFSRCCTGRAMRMAGAAGNAHREQQGGKRRELRGERGGRKAG